MIADLKPYPEYRESGLPWLGQMPVHWEMRRSKVLFREVDQRSKTGTETRLSMSQQHGLIASSQIEEKRLVSESNVGGKLCEPGDLVLNRLKAHLGVLALSPMHGLVSPDYTVLRPIGAVNQRYFCAVYRSPYCGQELRQRAKGIVEGFWRLYTDDFYDIRVPLPAASEQAAIVRFLDWANGRLERTIRAKRKVIAFLREQKQAIIHRAVTRGLDPSVSLKPSGIPWIGDIPQSWEVVSVGAATKMIQTGPFGSQLHSHEYVSGGTPLVNPSHMENGRIVSSPDIAVTEAKARELERHKLCTGDVIAARRGDLGRCALVTSAEEGWICGTGSLLLRCKLFMLAPAYFQKVFSSQGFAAKLSLSSIGATMANLNAGMVARQRMPLPPLDEQERIVSFIEVENQKTGIAISRLEREIDLLREYRTCLVADVVTGKLDVREAASRLPEEEAHDTTADDADVIDEIEPSDEEADG